MDDKGTEELFIRTALQKSWKYIRHSTPREDKYSHWDVKLEDPLGQQYKIDIKAHKTEYRNGPLLKDRYWIEWSNVRGETSWLDGKADIIVFHYDNFFYFYNREQLKEDCLKVVNFNKVVYSPLDALYCIYTRSGRQDRISLVNQDDLQFILEWTVP